MNRKLVFVLLLSAAEVMVGLPQALAAQSVNVSIAGFAYNPAEITISKGTTVIWTQNDAANHTVTSDTGLFDSGNLTTGQTFSLTFNEIGTFKYHCTIHVFMKGRVNVIEMQQRFNISGYKINSTDNNGSGIPDWKIMLLDSTTGMEIANTTTDDTGSYMFMDLANGTYTVTEEMKTGWMNTSQMEQMVTVDGMDVMNVNFSNALMPPQPMFNISGYKINSTNNNGSGIPDWKIMLQHTTTGMEIMNTTTNDTGFYRFMGLANGTYNVTEEMKTGWMNTSPMVQMVTINGMDVKDVNFSNALMPPQMMFNISGYKINSTNNNGSGIPNWKIMLQNTTTGMEIMNTTTNDTGFYGFMGLANGTYNVTEEMRTGWMNTSPMVRMVTITGMGVMNVNFTNALIPSA